MGRILRFISQLFQISYQEARGFAVLFVISFVAFLFILFPHILFQSKQPVDLDEVHYLDSLAALFHEDTAVSRFTFDPNHISPDSLMLLGFSEAVSQRINNYRVRGGRFTIKSDLKKIYGINEELVDSLGRWMDIPVRNTETKPEQVTLFDINEADRQQLKKVYMIGDVLAARIERYREQLGGFVSKEQYSEIYGLENEALKNLTALTYIKKGFVPKKIRINADSSAIISAHPYISDRLAADIVRYREINSTIESEKVLAVFKSIDENNFERLILYLDFQ